MQERDFRILVTQALVKLPGASEAAIKHELFDVLREFFNDSGAWIEDIPINIIPNTTVYSAVPTQGGMLFQLTGVIDQNNITQPALMPELGTIVFRNPYSQPAVFIATFMETVLAPFTQDFMPVMPDWVLPLWGVGILDGLIGKMQGQFGKPYSAQSSGYHLARFRNAIAQARVAALHRNTLGAQSWIYPQAGHISSQRGGVSVGVGTDTRFG